MSNRSCLSFTRFIVSFAFLFFSALALAVPVTDAPRVRLMPAGMTCPDSNCFTDIVALQNWIWGIRKPSTSKPLIVDIDAGVFVIPNTAQYLCLTPTSETTKRGHVTFRGAGQGNTVITGVPFGSNAVITLGNCTELSFENMTIRSDSRRGVSGSINAIYWVFNDGGHSTWTNVAIEATQFGWVDQCTSGNRGLHYWFASRIDSDQFAYITGCDESWIYGTDLTSRGTVVRAFGSNGGTGFIEIFGGSVRSIVPAGGVPAATQIGLLAEGGGTAHMHGGIISVQNRNTSGSSSVIGVKSSGGGSVVHVVDTAFSLKAGGSGSAVRVLLENGGQVESPFHWPTATTPPVIQSSKGFDIFVETDCFATGSCEGGSETHLMIYNPSCNTAGPWFNSTTGRCRGVIAP